MTKTEKRWGLYDGRNAAVAPKGYPKYAIKHDAALQRAVVVRVTITYEVPDDPR